MKNITILLVVLMSMACISAKAQQTSMTIDNQTPGWLSSRINYGDQQSLVNLKLTGYVNNDDIDFLINLTKKFSLKVLDTEELHFVTGGTVGDKWIKEDDSDDNGSLYADLSLRKLITSKYLKTSKYHDVYKIPYCRSDTMIIKGVCSGYTLRGGGKLCVYPEGVGSLCQGKYHRQEEISQDD